jgi:alkanesulfonate monooxygenase SsuD/methylene tetrahydromethanopterin reductase-like flavin-dependent oxidoreductase (luciferase family)
MVLGAALGRDASGRELSAFGEELDDRRRAEMLDESLELITALWSGTPVHHDGDHHRADGVTFLPTPIQRPRVPVWIGGRWPRRAPIRRAARWDGYFPIDLDDPAQLTAVAERVRELRGSLDEFDLIVETAPDADPRPWWEAGATWWLSSFGVDRATEADVRRVVQRGPPRVR